MADAWLNKYIDWLGYLIIIVIVLFGNSFALAKLSIKHVKNEKIKSEIFFITFSPYLSIVLV